MRSNKAEVCAAAAGVSARAGAVEDPIRGFFEILPRPIRFLGVGGLGLFMDLAVFTAIIAHGVNPLAARLVSLALATLLTWRLNRALTFDMSGLHPAEEAMRYVAVAAASQFVSYALFALLVLEFAAAPPQFALLIGAAAAALVSYSGQALFAFRPQRSA